MYHAEAIVKKMMTVDKANVLNLRNPNIIGSTIHVIVMAKITGVMRAFRASQYHKRCSPRRKNDEESSSSAATAASSSEGRRSPKAWGNATMVIAGAFHMKLLMMPQ